MKIHCYSVWFRAVMAEVVFAPMQFWRRLKIFKKGLIRLAETLIWHYLYLCKWEAQLLFRKEPWGCSSSFFSFSSILILQSKVNSTNPIHTPPPPLHWEEGEVGEGKGWRGRRRRWWRACMNISSEYECQQDKAGKDWSWRHPCPLPEAQTTWRTGFHGLPDS